MNIKIKNTNKGATIIEYALIAGLIAIVAISAMKSLGSKVSDKMTEISNALDGTGVSGNTVQGNNG